MLHCLLKAYTYDDLTSNPILGASWEGFCLEQILASKPSHYDAYFFRTQSGAEMDLVLTKGLTVEIAIGIKYSVTPKLTRSNLMAIQKIKPRKTWIIYPGPESYPLKDTIWTLPITQLDQLFA